MAILVEYQKEWHKLFKAQSKLIGTTLGKPCREIYHIGSTAIANVSSQPVIDMLVVLKDLQAAEQLCTLGYESKGNGVYVLQGDGIAYQAFCVQADDKDTFDAYIGIHNIHHAAPKTWATKKQAWVQQFGDDVRAYEEAKKAYFEQLAPEAREKKRRDEKVGTSLAIGMCLGMSIGTAIGAAFGNMATGMCLGVGVGMCLGLALGSSGSSKKSDK